MIKELTASQLAEWEAYDKLSLIGDEREDFRISYLATILTNLAIAIHGKSGTSPKKVEDFLFNWDVSKPKEELSPEKVKELFMGMKNAVGKQNRRKNTPPKALQK